MHPAHRHTVVSRCGQELVFDPDFNDTAFWTEGTGWAVANGVATASAAASGAIVEVLPALRPTLIVGERYRWVIVIATLTGGAFGLSGTSAPWVLGATLSAVGTHTGIAVATATTGSVAVRTLGVTSGTVTRFSVRRIHG